MIFIGFALVGLGRKGHVDDAPWQSGSYRRWPLGPCAGTGTLAPGDIHSVSRGILGLAGVVVSAICNSGNTFFLP